RYGRRTRWSARRGDRHRVRVPVPRRNCRAFPRECDLGLAWSWAAPAADLLVAWRECEYRAAESGYVTSRKAEGRSLAPAFRYPSRQLPTRQRPFRTADTQNRFENST